MKAVDMTTKHEPPESVGDCFRCCIASIMDLPASEVPHVYEGAGYEDKTGAVGKKRLDDWLAGLGLFFMEFRFTPEGLKDWRGYMNCHHTLSGIGPRGFLHCCVGYGGEVVHDPHPSRAGITPDDGHYLVGFICKK